MSGWAAATPARWRACSTSRRAARSSGHLVRRRVLKVDYDPARPGERGMFFGAAGIYDGIHLCTGNIHTRGLTGSWASTATLLTVLGRALMRGVEVDRHRRRGDRRHRRRRGRGQPAPGDGAGDDAGSPGAELAAVLEQWRRADPLHGGRPPGRRPGPAQPPAAVRRQDPRPAGPALPQHRGRPAGAAVSTRPFTIDGEFFQAAPGAPVVITAAEEVRYVKLRR